MTRHRSPQRGFAAVAAIFLVVVLAALGGYMVSFSNTQQLTGAQDVQGSRAYWAARAGLEWGVAAVMAAQTPGSTSTECPTTPTSLTVQGMSVVVACTATSYTEGGSAVRVLSFNAIASAGAAASPGFVERSVSASLER